MRNKISTCKSIPTFLSFFDNSTLALDSKFTDTTVLMQYPIIFQTT